ncbi:MAG: peptidylprolyl isomerase [Dehalococcoidia bacterium]|nr:peptidylprolyl isomerase [Dehalococcoidia bacterium]
MTKKHHAPQTPHAVPHRMQSRLVKEARTRRIIVIAGTAFIATVALIITIGLYIDNVKPRSEVILTVNEREFQLGYFVDMLETYTRDMDPTQVGTVADAILPQIVQSELIRQGARAEGIFITDKEIDAELEAQSLSDKDFYRDAAEATLSSTALNAAFLEQVPTEMLQSKFQILPVESRSVADEVKARVAAGESLVDLAAEYSVNTNIPVEQDWLPTELLVNADVARLCDTLDIGTTATVRDDDTAKYSGYWLIEVIDKDSDGAIKTRAMLLSSKDEALQVKARLATEDFATLAAEYSQFMGGDENAELDWVGVDDTVTAAFNEAAFALEMNTVSEPILDPEVQTLGANWVVTLLGREVHVVAPNIADALASQAFNEWYETVYDASVVEQSLTTEQKQWAIERVTD